jgi:hypothetical protein
MKFTKAQRHKLDYEWQCEIMGRLGNRCFFCPSVDGICGHHLIYRGNLNTRWDLRNGISVCQDCHVKIDGSMDTVRSKEMFEDAVIYLVDLYGFDWHEFSAAARTSKPLPGGNVWPVSFKGIKYAPSV